MAAVLKTVSPKGLRGSNPLPSAKRNAAGRVSDRLFLASGGIQACLDDVGRRKQPVDPVGQQLHSMLCRAPRRAGRDVAEGEIPEAEGLFWAIEINLLILNQIRHRLPVFHSGFPARRPLQYAHKFFRKLFICG